MRPGRNRQEFGLGYTIPSPAVTATWAIAGLGGSETEREQEMEESNAHSTQPETLWRYRPTKNNFARTLIEMEGETWCAFAESLNDPFDGISNSVRQTVETQFRSSTGEIHNTEEDRQWGVVCFSESWSNPTMWAHYADNCRGNCYGYSHSRLKHFVSENNAGRSPIGPALHPKVMDLRKVGYLPTLPESFEDPYQAMSAKSKHWEYEDEWRLLIQAQLRKGAKATGFQISLFDCVTDVLFGPYINNGTTRAIWQYIEAKKLKVRMKHLTIDKHTRSLVLR